MTDFDAQFAAMKKNFIERLPAKADEIDAAIARRAADDVRTFTHRLRGTAGSYGLPTVSKAAGALEDRVIGAANETLWTDVEDLLAALRLAIQELT